MDRRTNPLGSLDRVTAGDGEPAGSHVEPGPDGPASAAGAPIGPAAHASDAPEVQSGLFGRGLLYVVVWSLQLVAGTVVSPVLAHLLGPTEFGALSSAIALYQVLSVLALLGLDQALVIQRGEDRDGRNARGLIAVGLALATIVALLATATVPLWQDALGFGAHPTLVIVVILWTAPAAAVQIMLSLLLAEDRLRAFSLVSGLSAVGGLVFGLALLLFVHLDAVTYAWGGVASQFSAMAIALVLTRPSIRGLINWGITWRAIRLGFPLAMGGLAYFILNAGDRVIIQSLLGAAEVGRYQVAYVVGSTVIMLLTFTSAAWTPRFAALRTAEERWALAASSRDELYRLLLPITVGITLAAPAVLRVVAPASFHPDSLTLVVFLVALSAFAVAASGATGRLLVVSRRGKTIGLLSGLAAVVNVVLNLLLVPPMGITGSALATLLAYVMLAALQLRVLPREPVWVGPPVRLVLAIAAVCIVAAASTLLPQSIDWNLARLALAVACLPWLFVRLKRARGGGATASGPSDAVQTSAPDGDGR